MKTLIATLVVLGLIASAGYGYYVYEKNKARNENLEHGILQLSDFSIDRTNKAKVSESSVGTISSSREGNKLVVSVIEKTQSCGSVLWKRGYLIDGDTLTVYAHGKGTNMDCPIVPAQFNFTMDNLPNKNFEFSADVEEDLSLSKQEYNSLYANGR